MDTSDLLPRTDDDKFLGLKFDDRWNHLRHVIVQLYLGKDGKSMTLAQLASFMKEKYNFHAA